MLCTRCHHDVHRQGWEILVRAGSVDFIPPPQIDPMRRARPGGLAAIDVGDVGDAGGGRGSGGLGPPWGDQAWEDPAWEDPAWDGYPPPDDGSDRSVDHEELARAH